MKYLFDNPFTWAAIGFFIFLTFMSVSEGKVKVAREKTKQLEIQLEIKKLK